MPDPNSWANPRGRRKGKGTTTKARQARRATSPRVLAKREKRAEEAAAAAAGASSAHPLQQGNTEQPATQVAEPLQQGDKGQAAKQVAEPLQQGDKGQAATQVAEPLQQGDKGQAATQVAEPLQQGDKGQAATKEEAQVAEPLQEGEKKDTEMVEPLQEGKQEKEAEWETALGKRARSKQRRKASKERQWQVKQCPLPEGKVAEPLQEGSTAGRPASSAAGRRKTSAGYVGLGSNSSDSSTQQSRSSSVSTGRPLKQGTPATPTERGTLETRVKLVEKKKVLCLDWHNVFQIQDKWTKKDIVPDLHISKVWDLQAEGWEVHIVSFCGRKRAQEVTSWAYSLPLKWASVRTCSERTGKWGKTAWAKWLGCTHLVDDNRSICQEALEEGLEVLPVVSEVEPHIWYWGKPCQSFIEAVDKLLMDL